MNTEYYVILNCDWRLQIASQAVPLLVEVIAHPQSRKVKYHFRGSGVGLNQILIWPPDILQIFLDFRYPAGYPVSGRISG